MERDTESNGQRVVRLFLTRSPWKRCQSVSVRSTNQPGAGEKDRSLHLSHFSCFLSLSLPPTPSLLSSLISIGDSFSASLERSRNTSQLRGKQRDLVKDQAVNQSSQKTGNVQRGLPPDHTSGQWRRLAARMLCSEAPEGRARCRLAAALSPVF